MQNNDSLKELRDATAYLQKTTGHILTHQEFQKKHFEAQSQKHDQQIRSLTQSAQTVAGSTDRLVSEAANGIREQARDAIEQGVAGQLATIRNQSEAAAAKLMSAVEAFAQQKMLLDKERRKYGMTWMGGIVVVAMLAVFGVGSYAMGKQRELDELQAKADYLSAYNAADVAPTDGQLWVNIDPKSKRTINGKTYYRAEPR